MASTTPVDVRLGPLESSLQTSRDQENPAEDDASRNANWAMLQEDPRLQQRVSVKGRKPKVSSILEQLQNVTSVPLSGADAQTVDFAFESLSAKAPVWKVMRDIVLAKGVTGSWEKVGDGYRLRLAPDGKPPLPLTRSSFVIWCIVGGVGLVCLGLWIVRSGFNARRSKNVSLPQRRLT